MDSARTDRDLYKEAIKSFSRPSYLPGIVYLVVMLAMISAAVSAMSLFGGVVAFVVSVLLFGLCQYYAIVASHEAIHYGLYPNKKVNDFLGALMGYLVTFDYHEIKRAHLAHHRWLGSPELDPDYDFYIKPTREEKISALGLLLRPVQGLANLFRTKPVVTNETQDMDEFPIYEARKNIRYVLLFQVVLMAGFYQFSPWLVVAWIVSLVGIPGFLMHVRLIVEHSGLIVEDSDLEEKRLGARSHVRPKSLPGIILFDMFRLVVAPFSFNYHHEHHAMPTIPYYNLWKANQLLLENGYYQSKKANISRSYFRTIRDNFRVI